MTKQMRKRPCASLQSPSSASMPKRAGLRRTAGPSLVIINTLVNHTGLVLAVETTAANCHDSKPLLRLLDKAEVEAGARVHADKAYCSQKHSDALKSRS